MTEMSATATAAELHAQLEEAKDEIERLRAALDRIRKATHDAVAAETAREALEADGD